MAKPWKILDLNPDESLKQCLHKIALTRIQETFSIFRGCFSKKKLKKHDARIQSLIRALGAVRERDVFLESLSAYKNSLEPADRKVIDLLIARETTARVLDRKNLMREMKFLRRIKYADSFAAFVKTSL